MLCPTLMGRFLVETKINTCPDLPQRASWGNTGKAFGDKTWNAHPRFCQMLCPYDITLESFG
jgi:hypothetical protein